MIMSFESATRDDWPERDLLDLVSGLGGEIAFSEEVTQLKSPRQLKAGFKLVLTDGRIVKARVYPSEQKRHRVSGLAPLLEGLPFARIIAARGRVTLEEWVEGTPLHADQVSEQQAYEAGGLLGSLHCRGNVPADMEEGGLEPGWHMDKINAHLSEIADHAPETVDLCRKIRGIASSGQPQTIEAGLIHADFCAENIIVSTGGTLVVIDNELLRVGALDFDLARCWGRWPMSDGQRHSFTAGYRQYRGMEQFMAHSRFWAIRALAMSLLIRLRHGQRNEPALAALQRLAGGQTDRIWPAQQA